MYFSSLLYFCGWYLILLTVLSLRPINTSWLGVDLHSPHSTPVQAFSIVYCDEKLLALTALPNHCLCSGLHEVVYQAPNLAT